MADMTPPFADAGELRAPSAPEQENGFPCGPADRALFNWLWNNIQGNVKHVGDQAGVTPVETNDHTYLFRALQAYVASVTGADLGSEYLLMDQARSRLLFFPDVQNVDGKIVVTSPGVGQVRVPGGVTFLHRGIFPVVTVQTDLPTNANKIYHLRWNPTDGFVLRDLASGTYNPSAFAETNSAFDSTYDDMLVARVVTNSGNNPTITNLSNKDRYTLTLEKLTIEGNLPSWGAGGVLTGVVNFARTPTYTLMDFSAEATTGVDAADYVSVSSKTRYGCIGQLGGYGNIIANPANGYISGALTILARMG